MSYPRPFTTFPGIVQRSPNFTDLQVRDRPEVTATRLWGSTTLVDAYGTMANSGLAGTGGTMFAEAERGTSFVSRSWARTQLPEESRRGMTRYYFNQDDFVNPALPSPMPADDATMFVRLQESHLAFGGFLTIVGPLNPGLPVLGPILVVPPSRFWAERRPALSLGGIAPSSTGCVDGSIPVIDETLQIPPPMHIVLPRPATYFSLQNLGGAGVDLLFSAGLGVPMTTVTTNLSMEDISIREIVLARAAGVGGCAFSLVVVIGLEG